ncbi:TPA: hypothetical protein ACH3X2_005659 [Trebouxia sp. C0005]
MRLSCNARWVTIALASFWSLAPTRCVIDGHLHHVESGYSCSFLKDLPRLYVPRSQEEVLWPDCTTHDSPTYVRVHSHHTRSNVAIVMLDVRELDDFPGMVRDMMSGKAEPPELLLYYQAVAYNNLFYAMRHGYDFLYVGLFDDSVFPTERMPVWQRIAFLRGILPLYEYLFMLDSDAYVRVQAITVHDVVKHFNLSDDKAFLCPRDDEDYVNVGVMLLRRDPISLSILEDWWAAPMIHPNLTTYLSRAWSLEQHVFNSVMTNHPNAIVAVMPVRAMTTPEGAFVRHIWASGDEHRSNILNKALGEIFSVFLHEVLFPERMQQAKKAFMQNTLGYAEVSDGFSDHKMYGNYAAEVNM